MEDDNFMPILTAIILFTDYTALNSNCVLIGGLIRHGTDNVSQLYNEWKVDDLGSILAVIGFGLASTVLYKYTSLQNASCTVKVLFHISTVLIPLTTAPLIGESILNYPNTQWSDIILDDLTGLSLFLACILVYKSASYIYNSQTNHEPLQTDGDIENPIATISL